MSENTTEIIPIDDVNALAELLTQWHTVRIARVHHMLDIPSGTDVEFEEGETLVLEGDSLKAFRLGIQYALKELGQLPLVAQYDSDD